MAHLTGTRARTMLRGRGGRSAVRAARIAPRRVPQ
jgi:hypothetical protein